MDNNTFNHYVEELRRASIDTLLSKSNNYSDSDDRLHNFHAGAAMSYQTPAQVAWGYMVKHLVALRDKIEADDFFDREDFLEKCQDIINYIVLIWCIGNEGNN